MGGWRSWGSKVKYHHDVKGGNSRLDTVQAAVLSVKLRHLDECNANRRRIAQRYTELLAGVGDMVLPTTSPDVEAVWHCYVTETSQRDPHEVPQRKQSWSFSTLPHSHPRVGCLLRV